MIIPVRCWSCGKPIGHLWQQFQEKINNKESIKKALDSLGLERYCCRAAIMSNINIADLAAQFKKF